ncbi:unnamed protein product [Diabrotica balteata]|uniref:Uncharacterized protein n=1 Tax=Diabrotica balteata TaxID=107213 RepID=A0A9N9XHZ0_DIABA|nr:unnamed protein product [Diabrotica balteata]
MEMKQEATEKTCKTDNETSDGPLDLDGFKIKIKEELKTESAYDAFDYLDSNVFSVKAEVEQDEHKFTPFEETQTTNEEKYILGIHKHSGEELHKCETCLKQFVTLTL